MSQKINKIICIIAMWGLLIYVGYNVLTVEAAEKEEEDFLSPENVDRSINLPGENEPGFIKTPELKRAEELEVVADLEDDLADAETSKEKKMIQGQIDKAKEKFGLDEDIKKLTGYDEEGRQLNVINGDYDEEPKQKNEKEREWYYNENTGSYEYMTDKEIKEHNLESESGIKQGEKWGPETPIEPPSEPYPTTDNEEVIEDWGNTVTETTDNEHEETIKEIGQNIANSEQVHGGAELEYVEADNESNEEEQEQDEPEQEEEQEQEEESNDDESEESSDSNENEEDNSSE